MKVTVIGGTGVAGRHTVTALRAAGHDAVALSRSTGVDIATGDGLAEALAGSEAVVDATNVATIKRSQAESFFAASATHLARAADEAGVGHIVALSIIGIDRVPFGYYQGKLRQEQILADSKVPVTVLRASQFHEFAAQFLQRSRGRLLVVPRWRVQPVSAREVGETLARLATSGPVGMTELAGPGEERLADLVRRVAGAREERRRVWEVRLPGKAGKAMAAGGSLPTGPGLRGTQTFSEWLQEQKPPSAP